MTNAPKIFKEKGKKKLFAGYKEVLIEIQHTCGKKEILFRESLSFLDGNSMIMRFLKKLQRKRTKDTCHSYTLAEHLKHEWNIFFLKLDEMSHFTHSQ